MFKKIETMTKKTKVILMSGFALVLVLGGTGIAMYAREQSKQDELRRQVAELYHGMNVPQADNYNDEELQEYTELLVQKEQAFTVNDLNLLSSLSVAFETLHNKVTVRVQKEADEQKTKEEAERKAEEEQTQSNNDDNSYKWSSGRSSQDWSSGRGSSGGSSDGSSNSSNGGGTSSNDAPSWSQEGQGGGCKGSSCSDGWSGWH